MTALASDGAIAILPPAAAFDRLLAGAIRHLATGGPPAAARIRTRGGAVSPLPIERWVGPADAVDTALLAQVEAPVLDVGCGPGRHLAVLAEAGREALGVDLSPFAVRLARGRGGTAVRGSVFGEVPRAGAWRTALLLDGNVGIGGAPAALLRRVAGLLAPRGATVVEVGAPGSAAGRTSVRIEAPGLASDWFPWARVAAGDVKALAAQAGFELEALGRHDERWFAHLRRR
jgi:SAM-dependent methyltransferase